MIRERNLKKISARSLRQKKYTSIQDASLIGLIFEIEGPDQFKRVVKFAESLEQKNRKVICLGITNFKEVPDYCKFTLTYQYVAEKNYNWIGVPEKKTIDGFIHTRFDILINLSRNPVFTLEYINIVSFALLKVGIYNELTAGNYDLMISVKPDIEPAALYDHYIHYLETIKSL